MEFEPTNKLRFVEREVTFTYESDQGEATDTTHTRILQQQWEMRICNPVTGEVSEWVPPIREWRDVPIEKE